MFSNRSVTALSRNRPFAPLASQRWVTVVLAYLKEMEVIQTRRLEGNKAKGSGAGSEPQQDAEAVRPTRPPRKPNKEG